MAKIDKMVITEVGQNALWNSQNTGVDFEITHVEFGSSNASRDNEYKAIKLNRSEQFKKIVEGVKIKSDQIRIFTDFDGFKDYLVCEIGLWSGEPNAEGSVLFAYCASEDNKAFLKVTQGVDAVFSYDFVFTDQDISNVQVVADNDQSLMLTLIAKHESDLNAHPYYAHKEADNTFKEVNTFEKPIIGDLNGNADTTTKLKTARKIHGVDFDGTKNIDLNVFSTTKSGVVPQADSDGNKALYSDGTWKTVDLSNVGSAETAETLKTARTIAISGAVTGTATSFDGSKNITIPTTNVDGSKVTGTVPSATTATTATKLTTARKIHGVDFDGTKNIDLNVFSTTKSGVVPQADSDGNKALYSDGTWKTVDLSNVGSAETAETLKTARTIAISGAVTGTATSFDGSKNITIPTIEVDGTKVTGAVPIASLASFADNAENARSADSLKVSRKIHGVDFDGTEDIELNVFSVESSGLVPKSDHREGNTVKFLGDDGTWQVVETDNSKTAETLKTARTIGISGAVTGTATSFNGSANITIPTTAVDGSKVTGTVPSATTATTATKANTLTTARTIALSGAVTGTATSFNGSANISIPTTSVDGSKVTGTVPSAEIANYSRESDFAVRANYATNAGLSESATTVVINPEADAFDMETGSEPSVSPLGLSLRSVYRGVDFGYPIGFGNLISIKGKNWNATTEILHEWHVGKTRLFVRSKGDIEGQEWTPFRELAFKDEVSSLNYHTVDVTNSRAKDTIYTNTTGALLGIVTLVRGTSSDSADLIINGISVFDYEGSNTRLLNCFVGNLETYKVTGTLQKFIEHTSSSAKLVKAIGHAESGLDEMKYYKKEDTSDIYAFSADGSQDFLITEDFIELTDDEKDRHLYPEKYMLNADLELNKRFDLPNISKAQFQLVLLEENRLDDFESLISKITDSKIRRKIEIIYQSNSEFKRESEILSLIVKAKILTEKELDEIWEKAVKLAV